MNKTIFKSAFYSLLVLLCISCSNDLAPETEIKLKKIVLNSVFTPGEIMSVHLSTTKKILDPTSEFKDIVTADVEVTDNASGEVYKLNHAGQGIYLTEEFRPSFGREYSVTAHASGFKSVSATSNVPVQATVTQTEVYQGNEFFEVNGETKRELFVNLEFESQSDATQYYVWEIIDDEAEAPSIDFDFGDVVDGPVLLQSIDSNTESVLADESFQTRVFLTDDGSQETLASSFVTLSDPVAAFQFGDVTDPDADVLLKVRVMTVSKDLYDYYRSIEIYRLRGEVNSSITQPVEVYSNIDGGLGIFAGLAAEVLDIRLN